ncbi:MAG: insulinase family protein [Betaproteobacteria bacterium]|nr:insulinase family protein [Betaproteobacteria bacterium]
MRSNRYSFIAGVALMALAHAAHALLPIQHWETSRGARVYFVENRDLPMLDVSVDFPAGSGFDTREKSGTANMTNNMLRLGAGGMNEDEVARKLADIGAQFSGRFDNDRSGVGMRMLSSPQERKASLEMLGRILNQPEFPASVLEREKARLIAALKEADTMPDTIAARTFSRMIYPTHPYGLRGSGEVDTIAKLTRDDLAAFHRRYYTAERAIVAIMGDVGRDEAAAIAEALTSALPKAAADAPVLPPVPPLEKGETRWITHPATQSHILMGGPGIRREDPDYFALFVGNHILGGGGFNSRMTDEVRQKRGLAYSAYSYFSPLLREGPFVIGMQTKGEQAKEALAVARKVVTDFVAQGPTAKELAAAKQNIVGGFPLRIDSNRKIHEYLAVIGFYRLPLTYLDDFVGKVERITAEQVKAAFQRRVHPDRLVTVVVGQAEQQAALEETARRP